MPPANIYGKILKFCIAYTHFLAIMGKYTFFDEFCCIFFWVFTWFPKCCYSNLQKREWFSKNDSKHFEGKLRVPKMANKWKFCCFFTKILNFCLIIDPLTPTNFFYNFFFFIFLLYLTFRYQYFDNWVKIQLTVFFLILTFY